VTFSTGFEKAFDTFKKAKKNISKNGTKTLNLFSVNSIQKIIANLFWVSRRSLLESSNSNIKGSHPYDNYAPKDF
jgi:hypothetical protein